jgi:diguanylate cyclase (GGDEF)-like protein/PAS domain S-box-containing protein
MYQTLFEQAHDPIFLFRDHEVVDCNRKAVELFDVPREELIDRSPIDFSPDHQPDGRRSEEKARELIDKALEGDPQRFEWVHRRPSGETFKTEVSLKRIDMNGEAWCQAICRELSYRRKFHRTRQFLEQTIESTADGILVTGNDLEIKFYNQRFLSIWDIPERLMAERDDEVILEYVLDRLKNPEEFEQRVQELRTETQTESFDRIEFNDGTILERYSRPLIVDEEPVGRVWSFRDVTEREKRQQRLEEARTFLRTIVSELPLMLSVKGTDEFRFAICNQAMAEFFGREKEKLRGLTDYDLLPEKQAEEIRAQDREIVETGKMTGPEEIKFHGPNDQRWLQSRKAPVTDSEGHVQYILVLTEDISDRKEAEQELSKTQEKLRELTITDDLTGVRNRRFFRRLFNQELSKHYREQRPISVVMMDIDCFKEYNDHYGHPAGDHCLKRVAQALDDTLKRSSDILARYGGEEFIVLLPETDRSGAREIARQCVEEIRQLEIEHCESSAAPYLTISAGVATEVPQEKETSDLIHRADEAMYVSKENGRNQITVYEDA